MLFLLAEAGAVLAQQQLAVAASQLARARARPEWEHVRLRQTRLLVGLLEEGANYLGLHRTDNASARF